MEMYKCHNILVVYQEPKTKHEDIKKKLSLRFGNGLSSVYDELQGCVIQQWESDKTQFKFIYMLDDSLNRRICGMQLYDVQYLEGLYSSDTINYCNTRIRGGISYEESVHVKK